MAAVTKWGSYWYEALNTPLGIYIKTNSPLLLRPVLYGARKKLDDPALANLTIRTSPMDPKNELWIIRKDRIAQG